MPKLAIPFKAKFCASGIHLCLSLLIFLTIASWLYWVLYPSFYFSMSGGEQGLRLMLGVDVVLGPLLTFLVFNPHKKLREIIMDLVLVGIVQLAALGYGVNVVYHEQPKLLVMYDKGTAIVLNLREINESPELKALNLSTFTSLEKIPFASAEPKADGSTVYTSADKLPASAWANFDAVIRPMITDSEHKARLAAIEQQHGKVYVIAAMGKYEGKYLALDKQLQFVGEIGAQSTQ